YFANGKRIRESVGPSKRQAELALAKRKSDLREGRYFAPREKPLAFSVLATRYLEEHARLHKRPRSFLRNQSSTKVLVAYCGDTPIAQMTSADVHAFVVQRREYGKSGSTNNAELAHLSSLFSFAQRVGLTSTNPCKGVPRLKANRK